MTGISCRSVAVAVATLATPADVARADDPAGAPPQDVRALVKEEMKAYLDKKKEDDEKGGVMKATWKDGLTFESADKKFKVKIGGRIHIDDAAFQPGTDVEAFKVPAVPTAYPDAPTPKAIGEIEDALYFRRVQLVVSGEFYEQVEWKVQLEFASGDTVQPKDVYAELKDLKPCLGCWAPNFRAGHFFDPVGLESQSSTNYNTFIERSLADGLAPQRSLGFMAWDHFWKDRATLFAAVMAADPEDDDNKGFAEWKDGWAATIRGTLIPWAKDTCHLLHVGASYSHREVPSVRYRARPEVGFGPRLVDTGDQPNADAVDLFGAEAAVVWGPLSVQGEYILANVSDPVTGDPAFSGWYAYGSWFLTGESRNYDFKNAKWGRTRPCCNFLEKNCCCLGALELAVRYSTLDLTDGLVFGGELSDWTIGVNWYLNPNARIMFDFIHANVENVGLDDHVDAFLTRFQVDF